MSAEEHKAVMRRIYEVINTGNLALADEVIAADVVDHALPPGTPPGLAGFKQTISDFRAAFPDLQFTIEDLLAEGDRVVARFTMRGTHRGEFLGIPPTGKAVSVAGIDIARFADGKGVEHWASQDDLGLLQQLGALPAPGEGQG